jgi:hypothetical protein
LRFCCHIPAIWLPDGQSSHRGTLIAPKMLADL